MDWTELPGLFPGFDSPDRWLPLLQRHAELLERAAAHTRVTSVAPEDAIQRHYAESLEMWRIALQHSDAAPLRMADVGSGGGFPGLVLACIEPAVHFDLIEPLQKRARLLEAVAGELGLENVTVHPIRAEDAGRGALRGATSIVTARAVAELRELLEYCAPLCRPGGLLALPKGSGFDDELAGASNAMGQLSVGFVRAVAMRPEISANMRVAVFSSKRAVSRQFPRQAGLPHKRPL